MATGARSRDNNARQLLQTRIGPRRLIKGCAWGVTLRSLECPKHRCGLLEDLFQHMVLEFRHQSSSAAEVLIIFSHNHKAAEPAMPASAPYFAATIGISLARRLMLHLGRDSW